ncbi:MPP7 [Cordylochernes scorpioides]|uniref:MPP7 n=1 Tax=Cordylochernes scorpioides TaxID=51811 RepID=A0ABY6L283_9ARAC|nr:MPP7 [Cordylochernes scorpioides]
MFLLVCYMSRDDTSRARQDWEHDGHEYHFVDRQLMEQEIHRGKFVEYGQYRSHLYGTSLDMVLDIVRDGYVCVINPIPQVGPRNSALPRLYTADLKPYVVFIKPPSLEVLRECRQCPSFSSCTSHIPAYHNFNSVQDEECEELVDTAHKIEQVYGHMFDLTIINDDLPRAFQELLVAARLVELEPQWAPADWQPPN